MRQVPIGEGRHLRDYWMVVVERKWLALSCFVLAVGAGALLTFLQDPVYQAVAKVEILVQAPNPLVTIEEGTQPVRSVYFKESYFQTEFEKIRSRDLIEAVLEEHDLEKIEPFASAEDAAGLLRGMLNLDIVPTTDVVSIGAQGTNPDLCAIVANSVAVTYVHWNVDRRLERILETKAALEKRLQEEFAGFRAATVASVEAAERKGTLTPDLQRSITEESYKLRQADLRAVEMDLQQAEAVMAQVKMTLQDPTAGVSFSSLKDATSLVEVGRRRSILLDELKRQRAIYMDNHPDIQSLVDQLATVNLEMYTTLQSHMSALKAQRSRLTRAVLAERKMLMETTKAVAPLEAGEIEEATRAEFLEMLAERYRELTLLGTEGLLINQAQLIERARPPKMPIRPKPMMNMLVACLLGLLVGLGATFFLDYLDVSVKTAEDVEKGLGQNVLATIPVKKAKTLPLVRESIQSLRTALIFADKAKPTSTILFTSSTPKEGKSTTLANLGRALAAGGERTILLDCDFRVPTLSHIFQVPRDRGIASYMLEEEETWPRHIRAGVEENLDLFPTGPLPPNPTDILVSPRLSTLLHLLKREYDWILVDSPPVTSMSDATLLSDRVDGVVFVIRYDHVDQRTVRRALESLQAVGARILGTVLNAVDIRKPGYRDYFYGRYAYYGEEKRRKESEDQALSSASGRG